MKDIFGTSGGKVCGLCQSSAHRHVVWADVDPSPVLAAHRQGRPWERGPGTVGVLPHPETHFQKEEGTST